MVYIMFSITVPIMDSLRLDDGFITVPLGFHYGFHFGFRHGFHYSSIVLLGFSRSRSCQQVCFEAGTPPLLKEDSDEKKKPTTEAATQPR